MIIAHQKNLFFILMLLFGLLFFNNRPNGFEKVVNEYGTTSSDSVLSTKLELAFHKNSEYLLNQFFIDWSETVQSNTEAFVSQNDTIKSVFDSYKAFFKPLDLLKLGNWEGGNALNDNSKYVAVQNKIIFSITPAENFDDFTKTREISYVDSISDFRPPISMTNSKVLYLTPEYKKSLNGHVQLTPDNIAYAPLIDHVDSLTRHNDEFVDPAIDSHDV